MKTLAICTAALVAACLAAPARAQQFPAGSQQASAGGIQWFTRLKDGLAEARRTGRPILFLSAAPSCGGVPGVW